MTNLDRISLDGISAIRVATRSGGVTVSVGADDVLELSPQASVVRDEPSALVITSRHGGSGGVELVVPRGTDLVIGTTSGRIRITGAVGAVRASSESGAIDVESAASLDARTFSAHVRVDRCEGVCRIQTKSGEARVGRCDGRAEVATESGRVIVEASRGDLRVRTAQGAVDLAAITPVNVAVQTMSGRVRVALPASTRPRTVFRSNSGQLRAGLPEGDDCQVAVQTLSGALEVISA